MYSLSPAIVEVVSSFVGHVGFEEALSTSERAKALWIFPESDAKTSEEGRS